VDFWDFLLGVATGLTSHAIIKTAPKVKDKLKQKHYASRWKNPWYRFLIVDNILLVGISVLYVGSAVSWIGGFSPFDTLSIISLVIGPPLYFFLLRDRKRVDENYFVTSFTEALRNGELKFIPRTK
jgi:hypothetical protein